jgi:hypothetical protein
MNVTSDEKALGRFADSRIDWYMFPGFAALTPGFMPPSAPRTPSSWDLGDLGGYPGVSPATAIGFAAKVGEVQRQSFLLRGEGVIFLMAQTADDTRPS